MCILYLASLRYISHSIFFFFFFCLSLSLCLCLSACLFLCLSVCLSVSLCLSVCLSVCFSLSLSLSLSCSLFLPPPPPPCLCLQHGLQHSSAESIVQTADAGFSVLDILCRIFSNNSPCLSPPDSANYAPCRLSLLPEQKRNLSVG